ncbi:SMR family transporter, partial [Escherichia coli]
MKGWLFLVIAIVGEVIATSALKSSEGFTKLAPSAVVIIGYGIAFYWHCCKVSDEAAFCLIQRPYISKTLLT